MQKIKRVTSIYLWWGFIVLSPMNKIVSPSLLAGWRVVRTRGTEYGCLLGPPHPLLLSCRCGGGFGRLTPPHLIRSVFCSYRQGREPVHKLCWWKKHQHNQNIVHCSLTLGMLDMFRLIWRALFITLMMESERWVHFIQTMKSRCYEHDMLS
jgi:hypothetical protein